MKTTFYLGLSHFLAAFYKSIAPAMKTEPEASEVLRVPQSSTCPQSNSTTVSNKPIFAHSSCQEKPPPKAPLILTHPCQRFATCRKFHACHADEQVSDALHLPRKTTFLTLKVFRLCQGCHTQWTNKRVRHARKTRPPEP